jgi:ubiquitin carboxyl-terminal hydrolase 22/27/51
VCGHCKKKQPAVKQMSIRRLPPVLCLHIKRFEHAAGSSRVLRKLQGQLVFSTAQLDLSPFMTPTILRAR